MKIKIKENFMVAEVRDTKNADYKIVVLGAKDYSGTTSFVVNVKEQPINFETGSEVLVEFEIRISNRKVDGNYVEVIENKRLEKISKIEP